MRLISLYILILLWACIRPSIPAPSVTFATFCSHIVTQKDKDWTATSLFEPSSFNHICIGVSLCRSRWMHRAVSIFQQSIPAPGFCRCWGPQPRPPTMSTPNFTQCALDFQNSKETYANYVYTGPVQGILKHADLPLITVQGCRDLCGTGNVYYEWADIASTISTWILPILGLLLQCPFASNDFRNTLYTIARWLGSPVASLAYTLWI